METARLLLGSPMDVYAALGHGRSYGVRSRVFVRDLPGILECGLWNALEDQRIDDSLSSAASESSIENRQSPVVPTFALITDIGNDIMYGVSPQVVAQWVEECINRLQAQAARITMTMLPIENLRAVSRFQYRVVKSMMFPTRKLTFEQAISRAVELHDRIVELAQQRDVRIVEPQAAWYGFDPIHIRFRHWPAAWGEILSAVVLEQSSASNHQSPTPSLVRWGRLKLMTPQQWWLFNKQLGRPQPSGRLPDGSAIHLF